MKAIVNGVILTKEEELRGCSLLFEEKIIDIVTGELPEGADIIDAEGAYVAPGFIDLHIHGYAGEDTSDGSEAGIRKISQKILKNGVTAFLPTTMTVSWVEIEAALDTVRRLMPLSGEKDYKGAAILGCHAEGPFINPDRKGAQSAEHILSPDASLVLPHQDVVRLITMAPEMEGGISFIKELTTMSNIVVSIGHTNADYEQAAAAIEAGASYVTHLFNAMTGLNHRKPGVVGAVLDNKVYTELIADGFHVHTGLFPMLHIVKGEHLVLVTDCTRAGGLPDGEYSLGGQPIYVKGIECRLADGTIAGSVLRLNDAVRNLHHHGKVSLREAVNAASYSPAKAIGVDGFKGSLAPNKDADIILMDKNCRISAAYVRGTLKYSKETSD